MPLSKTSLKHIQDTYKDIQKQKINKEINSKLLIKKNKLKYASSNSSGPKTYILEGAMIKVYVTDKNGNQKCVKQIPLDAAPLSILLQVKTSNLSDAMLLQEAIDKKLKGDDFNMSNYNSNGDTPEFSDK